MKELSRRHFGSERTDAHAALRTGVPAFLRSDQNHCPAVCFPQRDLPPAPAIDLSPVARCRV